MACSNTDIHVCSISLRVTPFSKWMLQEKKKSPLIAISDFLFCHESNHDMSFALWLKHEESQDMQKISAYQIKEKLYSALNNMNLVDNTSKFL